MNERFVPSELRKLADLYEERASDYGDSYLDFGIIMDAMFPRGIRIQGIREWNRIGVLVQMVSKFI